MDYKLSGLRCQFKSIMLNKINELAYLQMSTIFSPFFIPARKAEVIVVACAVRAAAAAGINLVGVPQTKPMQ